MNIHFTGPIIYWKGPAPFYFVAIPPDYSQDVKAIAPFVTYGWGVIPVSVRIGTTTWQTSLFPKHDHYLVPIKASIRTAEHLAEGDTVTLHLTIGK
jgi:hypothetical protein